MQPRHCNVWHKWGRIASEIGCNPWQFLGKTLITNNQPPYCRPSDLMEQEAYFVIQDKNVPDCTTIGAISIPSEAAVQSIAVLLAVSSLPSAGLPLGARQTLPRGVSFLRWSQTWQMKALTNCSSYNPRELTSPSQPNTPAPKLSPSIAPLATALPLTVSIPVTHTRQELTVTSMI